MPHWSAFLEQSSVAQRLRQLDLRELWALILGGSALQIHLFGEVVLGLAGSAASHPDLMHEIVTDMSRTFRKLAIGDA